MNTVYFDTPGTLDLRAVTTFGLSVKETENPIGYFGTGLKYAVAILMRSAARIAINTGGERYEFATATDTFRNQEFEAIMMNDRAMPFTTELGKNWHMWMAFRELYCNTLDEKGRMHVDPDVVLPFDTTRISIMHNDFFDVYCNRKDYFIDPDKHPAHRLNGIWVYNRPSPALFYKNIRVSELQQKSLWTYNFIRSMDLTEDRTLSNIYDAEQKITSAVAMHDDKDFIHDFVCADAGSYEAQAHFNEYAIGQPSSAFLDTMKPLMSDHSGRVNESAQCIYRKWQKSQGEGYDFVTLTNVQQTMYAKAVTMCEEMGHTVSGVNIKVAKSLGSGVLGIFKKKQDKVILAIECFEQGTKMVAGTLMEELMHRESGCIDCTRGMQNLLVNRIVSMYEEKKGEPL